MEPDVQNVSGGVSIPVPMPDATKRVGTRSHPVLNWHFSPRLRHAQSVSDSEGWRYRMPSKPIKDDKVGTVSSHPSTGPVDSVSNIVICSRPRASPPSTALYRSSLQFAELIGQGNPSGILDKIVARFSGLTLFSESNPVFGVDRESAPSLVNHFRSSTCCSDLTTFSEFTTFSKLTPFSELTRFRS
jgi:hypothetical protein